MSKQEKELSTLIGKGIKQCDKTIKVIEKHLKKQSCWECRCFGSGRDKYKMHCGWFCFSKQLKKPMGLNKRIETPPKNCPLGKGLGLGRSIPGSPGLR